MHDWRGKTVLVTGGTRGIGLAVGLAFGALGARVTLTHRWGSADEAELQRQFAERGAPPPRIVEADVASDEDLDQLLQALRMDCERIDLFVSNVAVVQRGTGRFTARALRQSMQWSTWPLVRYFDAIREVFGHPPARVVAMSSDGHEHFYPGYDYVAASKAGLETLCHTLALDWPGTQCNVLRARQIQTTSFEEMFGEQAREIIGRFSAFDLDPEEVAEATVALSSGLLDACSGQVLVLDHGATFHDNVVAIGPRLLGTQLLSRTLPTNQEARRVHWVDAGLSVPDPDQWPGVTFVAESEPADAVVVAVDWSTATEAEPTRLVTTVQERMDRGEAPRYAVQIDVAGHRSASCAASNAAGKYFDGWRLSEDFRLNSVAIDTPASAHDALLAVRALTSGKLDAMRGQRLSLGGPR